MAIFSEKLKAAMKYIQLSLLAIIIFIQASCTEKEQHWPEDSWTYVSSSNISELDWSSSELEKAKALSREIGSMGWMLIENGLIIENFGDVTRKFIVQSVRKSFLSALYGIHVESGQIKLQSTLAELNIDDFPNPLSANEKKATIQDLLSSRSGVYHLAASSPEHMVKYLPEREAYAPGEYWYYNNWDFNALGTIYMDLTEEDIFESFQQRVVIPLGMQDFSVEDCIYITDSTSIHSAYHFSMSLRDIARFGLLYLRNGSWKDKQIITENWLEESTRPHTLNKREGYGYMWWIEPKLNSFSARGGSGQLILIIPERDIVFVHSVDRHSPLAADWKDIERLLRVILGAKD